jgi:hypothetical protein
MKNIHLLPTFKPSRLRYNLSNVLVFTKELYRDYCKDVNQHIYITSDEEIKEGDWLLIIDDFEIYVHEHKGDNLPTTYYKKIILTTDQDLIKDGIQAIDDTFLDWFVKNPSCESIEVESGLFFYAEGEDRRYKIFIPRDEPKQEAIAEAAENEASIFYEKGTIEWNKYRQVFELGSKWQAERSYSKEDLEEAFKAGREGDMVFNNESPKYWDFNQWFEQFKKK